MFSRSIEKCATTARTMVVLSLQNIYQAVLIVPVTSHGITDVPLQHTNVWWHIQ